VIELVELSNYTRIEQLQGRILDIFRQLREDFNNHVNSIDNSQDIVNLYD